MANANPLSMPGVNLRELRATQEARREAERQRDFQREMSGYEAEQKAKQEAAKEKADRRKAMEKDNEELLKTINAGFKIDKPIIEGQYYNYLDIYTKLSADIEATDDPKLKAKYQRQINTLKSDLEFAVDKIEKQEKNYAEVALAVNSDKLGIVNVKATMADLKAFPEKPFFNRGTLKVTYLADISKLFGAGKPISIQSIRDVNTTTDAFMKTEQFEQMYQRGLKELDTDGNPKPKWPSREAAGESIRQQGHAFVNKYRPKTGKEVDAPIISSTNNPSTIDFQNKGRVNARSYDSINATVNAYGETHDIAAITYLPVWTKETSIPIGPTAMGEDGGVMGLKKGEVITKAQEQLLKDQLQWKNNHEFRAFVKSVNSSTVSLDEEKKKLGPRLWDFPYKDQIRLALIADKGFGAEGDKAVIDKLNRLNSKQYQVKVKLVPTWLTEDELLEYGITPEKIKTLPSR